MDRMAVSERMVLARVKGPFVLLVISAIVGILFALGLVGFAVAIFVSPETFAELEAELEASGEDMELRFLAMIYGAMGLFGIVLQSFVLFGANRMRKGESWGLSLAAAICALVPFGGSCCLIGWPAGIWAIIVLSNAQVKAAFGGRGTVQAQDEDGWGSA
jgi:hypothetical protein